MFTILSVHFCDHPMDELLRNIYGKIMHHTHMYICVTGLHGLFEAQRNTGFLNILNSAAYTVSDGMPIVLFEKLIKKRKIERIYGPDLMLHVCAMAEKQHIPIFLFGTTSSTLTSLSHSLNTRFPKLRIAGFYAPPFGAFSENEKKKIYSLIDKSRAKIVFVGMSTPKQEEWMYSSQSHLPTQVLVGVGAAFDFLSGTKRQAPVWIQSAGFEWFFRLLQEPRRLSRRYVTIIAAIVKLGCQRICRKILLLISS